MITEQCPTAITLLIMQNIVGLIVNAVMLGETRRRSQGDEGPTEAAPPVKIQKFQDVLESLGLVLHLARRPKLFFS